MLKKLFTFTIVVVMAAYSNAAISDEDIEIITEGGETIILIDCDKYNSANNTTNKTKKKSSKTSSASK